MSMVEQRGRENPLTNNQQREPHCYIQRWQNMLTLVTSLVCWNVWQCWENPSKKYRDQTTNKQAIMQPDSERLTKCTILYWWLITRDEHYVADILTAIETPRSNMTHGQFHNHKLTFINLLLFFGLPVMRVFWQWKGLWIIMKAGDTLPLHSGGKLHASHAATSLPGLAQWDSLWVIHPENDNYQLASCRGQGVCFNIHLWHGRSITGWLTSNCTATHAERDSRNIRCYPSHPAIWDWDLCIGGMNLRWIKACVKQRLTYI